MTTIPAAIYVRISSDTEGTGLGVKRQRTDCEALAKLRGWIVAEVYEDNDVSASSGKARPAYERMVADIEAGHIRAVVVWDVDRLTRTPRELEDVIDFAERVGLQLASVGGDIDLGTEQGRMMARMKGTVARYEVEQARRRLRRKHDELAAAGRHIGPRPFGWDMIRVEGSHNALRVNKAERAIVLECVRRVLDGEGLWKIRNDLNARGVTTATGGPWQTQTLRKMLLRWRNCGVRTHKGVETGPGEWEALYDRETHERVVATLTDPARRANRGTEVRYLLTGIALCGACGEPLVGTAEFTYDIKARPSATNPEPRTRQRHYPHSYRCPHTGCHKVARRMADVDELVAGVAVGVLERDGVRVLGGDPAAEREARERVEQIEAKLALSADQFAEDVITGEQLARITGRLRPELEAERARLRRSQPDSGMTAFSGVTAAAAWEAATVDQRRRVLRALTDALGMRVLVDRVGPGNGSTFDPESVRIEWDSAGGPPTEG